MIAPREQWCCQIVVTQHCNRKCSNCTQLIAHHANPEHMEPEVFRQACEALRAFPVTRNPRPENLARQIIGMHGGEPLLHPQFVQLCEIMRGVFHQDNCGLWTGIPETHWQSKHWAIAETFGYLNHNVHDPPSVHQPVLVGIREVIHDEQRMWGLIDDCWLQRRWSCAITPKGFFFCEVAAAMDAAFGGPGGKPIVPGCWMFDIDWYRDQVERWCPRCGVCIPKAEGRKDNESRDDITYHNYHDLVERGSPRCLNDDVVWFDTNDYDEDEERALGWQPHRYKKPA